jgi:PAS domain S-box-containing protein
MSLPRILIVEMSDEPCPAISDLLGCCDLVVSLVQGTPDLFGILKPGEFSGALVATRFPKDGLEAAAQMKKGDPENQVPLLLMSSIRFADAEIDEAIKLGIKDFALFSTSPKLIHFKLLALARNKFTEHALHSNNLLLRSIIESTSDAIFVKDLDSRYLLINGAVARIIQKSSDDIVGVDDTQIFSPEVASRMMKNDQEIIRTGRSTTFDEATEHRAGASQYTTTKSPLRDNEGKIVGVVGISRDVTEIRNSEKDKDRLFKFYLEIGEIFGACLDRGVTISRVLDLALKWVGDSCIVHLKNKCGVLTQAGALGIALVPLPPSEGTRFVKDVDKNGELLSEIGEVQLRSMRLLGMRSWISVPMKFRDQVIGTISVQAFGRRYGDSDFVLIQELSYRAALAIQNSNLYADAQAAIRLRDDFLAVASHELKTPMTSLSLQVQSIQRFLEGYTNGVYPSEKMIQLFKVSGRQIHSLTEFIDGLLDVSRFAGGQLSLRLEYFDLFQVVKEIIAKLNGQPDGVDCPIQLDGALPVIGLWDRFRIEQVVTNLLTNAVKYGMGKPILIQVRKDGTNAILRVTDHGIGIAHEDQGRLFNRFERAVPGSRFRGLGLGLYITKEITQLHGGAVSLESELGKGSVFTVKIPLRLSA